MARRRGYRHFAHYILKTKRCALTDYANMNIRKTAACVVGPGKKRKHGVAYESRRQPRDAAPRRVHQVHGLAGAPPRTMRGRRPRRESVADARDASISRKAASVCSVLLVQTICKQRVPPGPPSTIVSGDKQHRTTSSFMPSNELHYLFTGAQKRHEDEKILEQQGA